MVKIDHETLGELVTMLIGHIEAEFRKYPNYVTVFNKKYRYLNSIIRNISGHSVKGGIWQIYIKNTPLVLSVLIIDKYKKILFTDIHGDTFIMNNPKWLYQYMSLKRINTNAWII